MRRLAVTVASLALVLCCATSRGADTLSSGPQPGQRIRELFHPVAVHYAANPDRNGERINPVCHYGPHPTVMVFARDVGPELEELVKRLDSEVGRHKGFQLGACVVLLTEEPATAAKKLRALKDRAKVERVSLAHFASAGPTGYGLAGEAEWTVLCYTRYQVAANQAVRKADLGATAVGRVIADIDTVVPAIKVSSGVGLAAGGNQALKVLVRRDRVAGPVTLKLTELRQGIRAGEVTVPAGQSEGWLLVTADKGAADGESLARGVVTAGTMRMEVKVSILVRTTAR
jgi:hypothetical protein